MYKLKKIKKLSTWSKITQQSSLAVYYNVRYIIRARPKDNFGLAGNIEAHAWSLDSHTDAATYWLIDLGQVTSVSTYFLLSK